MFHHNHQAGERETARHLIGGFASITLTFCLFITWGVGSAQADALPLPGKYTGTSTQTHTQDLPDPKPTVRPLTFEIDDSGRVNNLMGEYFWYCSGYFGTEKFTDTPLPSTRISIGVPFKIVWEDVASTYTFTGTVDASGAATGTLVADMGVWTASDGRKWRTECDTKATGRNGCRSYTWTTVYTSKRRANGGYTYGQTNKWVFNNLVLFRS